MNFLDINDHGAVYLACKVVSAQWRDLGTRLGVMKPTLDIIQVNNRGDVEGCMSEVIDKWLKRDVLDQGADPPTWRNLCLALSHIDKPLAESISVEHGCGYISPTVSDVTSKSGVPPAFLPQSCGCGQCTVRGWMTGKLCQNVYIDRRPKLLVVNSEHPIAQTFIRFQTDYHRQTQLCCETEVIAKNFNDVAIETWDYLQQVLNHKKYTLFDVARKLNSIAKEPLPLFTNLLDLQNYFHSLHVSWFNFDLLHFLYLHFLSPFYPELIVKWSKYCKKFKDYCSNRNLKEYTNTFFHVEDQNVFLLQVDDQYSNFTLSDIEALRESLSLALGIPSIRLHLVTVREGSLTIYFHYCYSNYLMIFKSLTTQQLTSISQIKPYKILSFTDLHNQFTYNNIQKYNNEVIPRHAMPVTKPCPQQPAENNEEEQVPRQAIPVTKPCTQQQPTEKKEIESEDSEYITIKKKEYETIKKMSQQKDHELERYKNKEREERMKRHRKESASLTSHIDTTNGSLTIQCTADRDEKSAYNNPGRCVIISSVPMASSSEQYCHHIEEDVHLQQLLFTVLGFDVRILHNPSADEMVHDLRSCCEMSHDGAFVLSVIGSTDGTTLHCNDGNPLPIETLTSYISSLNSATRRMIPKLCLLQLNTGQDCEPSSVAEYVINHCASSGALTVCVSQRETDYEPVTGTLIAEIASASRIEDFAQTVARVGTRMSRSGRVVKHVDYLPRIPYHIKRGRETLILFEEAALKFHKAVKEWLQTRERTIEALVEVDDGLKNTEGIAGPTSKSALGIGALTVVGAVLAPVTFGVSLVGAMVGGVTLAAEKGFAAFRMNSALKHKMDQSMEEVRKDEQEYSTLIDLAYGLSKCMNNTSKDYSGIPRETIVRFYGAYLWSLYSPRGRRTSITGTIQIKSAIAALLKIEELGSFKSTGPLKDQPLSIPINLYTTVQRNFEEEDKIQVINEIEELIYQLRENKKDLMNMAYLTLD